MNYKKLLAEYIQYVRGCEGIDFITYGQSPDFRDFTKEEQEELISLAETLEEKLEKLGFVFPQGEYCVKGKMRVELDMLPPYLFETGDKSYWFETYDEFYEYYKKHNNE